MNQQSFAFMLEELAEVIWLEEKEKETLVLHMTKAIIDVLATKERKADDN